MIEVPVPLGERSYRIIIAPGLLAQLGEQLRALTPNRRLAVVVDDRVAAPHLDRLRAGLAGFEVVPLPVPAGEGSKSFRQLERLIDSLLALEMKRSDVVLAFGGGVVGDLTGFAAAILKRGMHFVQVPTTLLAMVDSSVGGKTGINTTAGKNLAGAFHQPLAVFIDPELLETLPEREMQAGYAEIVKYGLIADRAFYHWCEENAAHLLAHDGDALVHAIAASCRAKAAIVGRDEHETGDLRALLNFGHTFGHALEAETGFGDRLLHGEAVGIGMAEALRFSAMLGFSPAADAERFAAHLQSLGMRAWPGQAGIARTAAAQLLAHMQNDKKREAGGLPFILARGIGDAFVARGIKPAEVEKFLESDLRH